jgi:hypothetical protein
MKPRSQAWLALSVEKDRVDASRVRSALGGCGMDGVALAIHEPALRIPSPQWRRELSGNALRPPAYDRRRRSAAGSALHRSDFVGDRMFEPPPQSIGMRLCHVASVRRPIDARSEEFVVIIGVQMVAVHHPHQMHGVHSAGETALV